MLTATQPPLVLSGPDPEYFQLIHTELRKLAGAAMRHERADHTLQPTALVNEAFLRLQRDRPTVWNNRNHFFSAAAQVMREILVDHARAYMTQKRGGERKIKLQLSDTLAFYESDPELVLAIDACLDRLRTLDPRVAQVVELRYFTGLSVPETAETMGISAKTVKRDWEFARVWLARELNP